MKEKNNMFLVWFYLAVVLSFLFLIVSRGVLNE